jgi:hypothetical protein
MKRTLLAITAILGTALAAHASLILSNSFEYADGPITTVSAGSPLGVWTNHSGSGAVEILGGKVSLSQSRGEDVSSGIPTTSSGTLYASFVVNFSQVPNGAGSYFWHFRDTGTGFRAKVWASTNGAAADSFRVGVSVSTNSPVYIPMDLSLNQDYKLVVRYDLDASTATLWINPTSEASANSVTANDSYAAIPLYSVCFRQTGSNPGIGVLTVDDLLVGTTFGDVSVIGGPPSISAIDNQSIPANSSTGPLAFTVSDVETPAESLVVTGTSDNPTLVPNNPANITFGGSGNNRTVTITPAAGQQGIANISIVVTDGNNDSATNTFRVTVGIPTISAIANQDIKMNTATPAIPFTVGDAETPNSLVVTAASSNPALVQDSKVLISGTGTSRTVTITPETDQVGLTTITLTVSDGTLTASSSFIVTVYPELGLWLGDDFTYPDGPIIESSLGFWTAHSGTSNDTYIASGRLLLTQTNVDDIRAFFTNSVYAPVTSGIILYSRFTVNFTQLPRPSGGGYFAHFKDTGTFNFRARVFAMTNGAAPGKFRLGISNGGFNTVNFPQDLDLNTPYTVVTRYNVGTGASTLWINPIAPGSPSVSATDPATPVDIWNYCFRQDGTSGGIGALYVDDLLVGTAFSDVVPTTPPPTPEPLSVKYVSGNIVLEWTKPAFSLEAASSITGPWSRISGASSPYSAPATDSAKFFRLVYP